MPKLAFPNKSLEKGFEIHNPEFKYVLEFGVFDGKSLSFLRELFDKSYLVYGFDCFTGLPEAWGGTGIPQGSFSTKGVIPDVPDTIIMNGLFKDTIPQFKEKVPVTGIALIHVDSDLYSSCKDVLYGLNDYIKPSTVIVFDEYVYTRQGKANEDHEKKCFLEWVKDFNRTYEFVEAIEPVACVAGERKVVKILS